MGYIAKTYEYDYTYRGNNYPYLSLDFSRNDFPNNIVKIFCY